MRDASYLLKHLYKTWLAVLPATTIGVLPSTITTTPGNRISTMATQTTTIRITQTMFVLFGVLNKSILQCRAAFARHCFNKNKMQLSLFDNISKPRIELHELFEAYYACRRNKRNTINALAFEVDYEHNLVQLCEEINHEKSIFNTAPKALSFLVQ